MKLHVGAVVLRKPILLDAEKIKRVTLAFCALDHFLTDTIIFRVKFKWQPCIWQVKQIKIKYSGKQPIPKTALVILLRAYGDKMMLHRYSILIGTLA